MTTQTPVRPTPDLGARLVDAVVDPEQTERLGQVRVVAEIGVQQLQQPGVRG